MSIASDGYMMNVNVECRCPDFMRRSLIALLVIRPHDKDPFWNKHHFSAIRSDEFGRNHGLRFQTC